MWWELQNGYLCLVLTFPPATLLFLPHMHSPKDAASTSGIFPVPGLSTQSQGRPHNSWCYVRKRLGPSWTSLGCHSEFPLSGSFSSLPTSAPASKYCGFLYLAIGLDHMNSCYCFVACFEDLLLGCTFTTPGFCWHSFKSSHMILKHNRSSAPQLCLWFLTHASCSSMALPSLGS